MFSIRTRISLAQYLELQPQEWTALLLEKHGMDGGVRYTTEVLQELATVFRNADDGLVGSLLEELARSQGDLRNRVTPRYRFDERRHDLEVCLMLDGYHLSDRQLSAIDPSIADSSPVEDDLTRELGACGLADATLVIQRLEASALALRQTTPNVNACLNDARVALETLAANVAATRSSSHPGNYDPTKWGSVIAYFRSTGFVTAEEEKGLVGVYGFVSPGSHRPLGLSDLEFARLGRSFVAGMCWFLTKRFVAGV